MKTNTDTNKSPMLGKVNHGGCRCCQDNTKVPAKRAQKRRERQAVRKFLSNI